MMTIRERMSVGRSGHPVSAKSLNCLFQRIKHVLEKAVQIENHSLSHFEVLDRVLDSSFFVMVQSSKANCEKFQVLTAMAFTLFAQENVDIAVIEVIVLFQLI